MDKNIQLAIGITAILIIVSAAAVVWTNADHDDSGEPTLGGNDAYWISLTKSALSGRGYHGNLISCTHVVDGNSASTLGAFTSLNGSYHSYAIYFTKESGSWSVQTVRVS